MTCIVVREAEYGYAIFGIDSWSERAKFLPDINKEVYSSLMPGICAENPIK